MRTQCFWKEDHFSGGLSLDAIYQSSGSSFRAFYYQGKLTTLLEPLHDRIVHGQSASCFVGSCKAEPEVISWSETTLWQLFQYWLSVISTSTFHVLFTTTDFIWCPLVFASSEHLVLLKFGLQDTLSYKMLQKCATLPVSPRKSSNNKYSISLEPKNKTTHWSWINSVRELFR